MQPYETVSLLSTVAKKSDSLNTNGIQTIGFFVQTPVVHGFSPNQKAR